MAVAVEETGVISKAAYFKATGYKPHHKQLPVHMSPARFRVVVAGRRWGKSLSAAKEAEVMILHPGTRGWIVSKTYDLTMKVLREIYADLIMDLKFKPTKMQMAGPYVIQFPWGSSVEGKSADHPESLLGEGLDWLIFDECAKCYAIVWEQYLRPTLTDREGWALFITTPSGYNWVYDLYKRGLDPDYPDWESFKSPSWENPHLSMADIEEARRVVPPAVFAQEYGADFTTTAGQVYQDFNEEVHIIPASQMKIDPGWRRFRAIDFGYENPFVCLWIAVDPQDRVYIYDEYYQRHRTVEHHAAAINGHTPRCDTPFGLGEYGAFSKATAYEYTVCDPSGSSDRATLLESGIPTVAMRSDVEQGLNEVRTQLKVRDDGRPGLFVSTACPETIMEFNLYSYPESGDDESPMKQQDHCMDALRYFIVHWRRGYITQYMPKITYGKSRISIHR